MDGLSHVMGEISWSRSRVARVARSGGRSTDSETALSFCISCISDLPSSRVWEGGGGGRGAHVEANERCEGRRGARVRTHV